MNGSSRTARTVLIERAVERVVSLPFASPGAFVLAQAGIERSRESLPGGALVRLRAAGV